MLALPWRRYSTHGLKIADHDIRCLEATNDPRGTGLIVWDGAIVLAKHLEKRFGINGLCGQVVLELGCGTGLAGISASSLGAAHVYLTDLTYALSNTQANVEANGNLSGNVSCVELDWTRPNFEFLGGRPVDLVLLADVAWVVELIPPLVATCRALASLSQNYTTQFVLSHQSRSIRADEYLFKLLEDSGLDVKEVPKSDYGEGFDAVKLYWFQLRNR